ncbi:MAG: hypothetical protein V4735_07990 [Pseudomonadota bacterium]
MSDETATEAKQHEDRWQDKTLKAAGVGYMAGDAAMAAAGIARGKGWGSSVGGAMTWFAGGLAAAHFGNPDVEKQLQIQASKLEAHLKKNGVTIPDEARAQSALLADKTAWSYVEQFMYEHPSELLNGMYALGASMLLHGGLKEHSELGKTLLPKALTKAAFANVSSKFWIGALVGAGALTGLLVKENPNPAPQDPNAGWLDHAIASVKDHPLRASAALYTVNNGFLALQAWQDFQGRDLAYASTSFKPHYASGLQLAAYLFSNAMLFSSSRNQITRHGFASQDMARLEDAAACVIAMQSPKVQQAVLEDVSRFMATQQGVTLSAPDIAQHVASRVTALTAERMQRAAGRVDRFAAAETARRETPSEKTLG